MHEVRECVQSLVDQVVESEGELGEQNHKISLCVDDLPKLVGENDEVIDTVSKQFN